MESEGLARAFTLSMLSVGATQAQGQHTAGRCITQGNQLYGASYTWDLTGLLTRVEVATAPAANGVMR